jgi:hypothetical protein
MALQILRTKFGRWLSHKDKPVKQDLIEQNGLLNFSSVPHMTELQDASTATPGVVEPLRSRDKRSKMDVFEDAINRMVDKLDGINDNLHRQNEQNAELIRRIDKLPHLVETLPRAMDSQKQVVDELIGQLKIKSVKDKQLAEVIAQIPSETARQSNVLKEISQKMSVCAESDVRMTEGFNRFKDSLVQLDRDTVLQTEGIGQMTRTFAESDRVIKQVIQKQQKHFLIMLAVSLGVCTLAIASLIVGIIVLTGP